VSRRFQQNPQNITHIVIIIYDCDSAANPIHTRIFPDTRLEPLFSERILPEGSYPQS
jgi:hypothetical protein